MDFYNYVRSHYDIETCNKLKEYSGETLSYTKNNNTLIFLLKCREFGVFPNFIRNSTNNLQHIFQFSNNERERQLEKRLLVHIEHFHMKLLNIAISLKQIQKKGETKKIEKLESFITRTLTQKEYSTFFKSQENKHNTVNDETKNTHKKKFERLKTNLKQTMGIEFQEKWFVNKTSVNFPSDVKWLLSMGPKFSLPIKRGEIPLFKIIADGEELVKTLEQGDQEIARSNFTEILQNHLRSTYIPPFEKFLNKVYDQTMKFLKRHKEVYIVSADKGNVTVAMYKTDYKNKMQDLMSDRNIYRVLRNNPTTTLQTKNNDLVKDLFEKDLISLYEKKRMTTYTANSPKIYGLPKIHKANIPLRPICASTNVPCYELSKFIVKILQNLTKDSKFNVKNSKEFIEKVSPLELEKGEILVSFDVVSLFTSIPIGLILDIIMKNWNNIKEYTNIKKAKFMEILRFCVIDNNFLEYDGTIFQQKQGVPMGSPASPVLADLVLETLLEDVLSKLHYKPKVITKYVDDLFAVIKAEEVDNILNALNSFNHKIQFTVEKEKNSELPYLDVQVTRQNEKLVFDWYRKPTASGRLLNFHSKQPKQVIINTAQNFINRVLDISDISHHQKNKNIIRDTLYFNSFPCAIVNKLIKNYQQAGKVNKVDNDAQQNITVYKSALFIPHLSNRISTAHIMDKTKTKIAFRSANSLREKLFTKVKGKEEMMEKSNIVYKINCLGGNETSCSSVYIGTSMQKLKNRLSGHKSDLNSGAAQKTALTHHCIQERHKPDFQNVEVLQTEQHYSKRMLLEMLHIINNNNAVNRKSDCDKLSSAYSQLIKRPATKSRAKYK